MSTLKELLKDIPVEWKALGDVCKIVGRIGFRGYTKKDIVEEKEGAISLSPSNIKDNEIDYSKCTYISWLKYEESPEIKINNGDIIFCKTASIGKTALIKSLPKEATINPQLVVFKEIKCNNGYLAHIVKSANFKKQISSIVGVGSVPSLSQKDLRKLQIPIPFPNDPQKSLAIQQEIVRVLDSLSEQNKALTTALTSEIDNRKKQYEYYREELFRFEGKEVEWKSLGDVGDVTKLAGYEFTKHIKYSDEGNIIALRGLNVKGKLDLTNVKYIDGSDFSKLNRSKLYINDMLFTYVGTIGEIALINENDKYYLAPNVSRIRFKQSNILPSFMFFYFKSDFFVRKQINKYLSSSSMKNLTMENIRKFMVPIPDLTEQERIVRLLHQFDTATKNIIAELEKEIELRNKQYEYYRNLLLMFND